jgi:hypothetical protein
MEPARDEPRTNPATWLLDRLRRLAGISALQFSTLASPSGRARPIARINTWIWRDRASLVLAHLLRKLAVEAHGPNGVPNRSEAKRRAAMMIAATFLGIIGAIVVVTFLNRIP